ncbi:MAG: hypothetical protein WAT39_26700, partial [Planctomycetota bacterium]
SDAPPPAPRSTRRPAGGDGDIEAELEALRAELAELRRQLQELRKGKEPEATEKKGKDTPRE